MAKLPDNIKKERSYRSSGAVAYSIKGAPFEAISYSLEKDWDGNNLRVVKYWMGKGLTGRDAWESQIVLKNVPESIAERFIFYKLDPVNNRPPKFGQSAKENRFALKARKKAFISDDLPEMLEKYGNPKAGIDASDLEDRPVLLYGGQKEGVVTDGFMMIIDQNASDDILGGMIEKIITKTANQYMRLNKKLSKQEARKQAEQYVETLRGGKYPDWKILIPKEITETWRPIGTSVLESDIGVVWFTNGKNYATVDIDKIALLYEQLPNIDKITSARVREPHERYFTGGQHWQAHDGPMVFEQKGKVKAVLMPVFIGRDSIPQAIIKEANIKVRKVPALERAKANIEKMSYVPNVYYNEREKQVRIAELAVAGYKYLGNGKSPDRGYDRGSDLDDFHYIPLKYANGAEEEIWVGRPTTAQGRKQLKEMRKLPWVEDESLSPENVKKHVMTKAETEKFDAEREEREARERLERKQRLIADTSTERLEGQLRASYDDLGRRSPSEHEALERINGDIKLIEAELKRRKGPKRTIKTPKKIDTVTLRGIRKAVKKAPPKRRREQPTPLSLSEARQINKQRSSRSQAQDKRQTAQNIIPPQKGSRWAKNPGRYDMRGVDTRNNPGR